MNGGLHWQVFLQDYEDGHTYLSWLVSAWGWTIAVALGGLAVALAAGTVAGIARTTPVRALALAGDAWTEAFRNVPLLVQVFLWYYALPAFVPALQAVPGYLMVVLALGFYTSGRISEQVKAGILAIPAGQRGAALALGLTLPQAYRHVLLPRAIRLLMPPLTSEAMAIVKNSSVAFAVSIPELTMFAMQAQEETARGIEIYAAVTAVYFASALAVARLAGLVERALRVPGLAGAPV
jgi:glutamate/aspartate transport system permease protein